MANNFTLGTAWMEIRAKQGQVEGLKGELKVLESLGNTVGIGDKLAQIKAVGNEISGLQKKIAGPDDQSIHGALRGVRMVGHAVSGGAGAAGIGAALGGPVGAALGEVTDILGNLASKANPAAMQQFNLAFADLQATIGKNFVPALQTATELIRGISDVVGSVLNPALKEFRNFCRDLTDGLKGLNEWMRKIGLTSSTRGAAAQQAKISSVQDYLKSANVTAFGSGGGTPDERTATATERILGYMTSWNPILHGMVGKLGEGVKWTEQQAAKVDHWLGTEHFFDKK